jgi:hypothetical protein
MPYNHDVLQVHMPVDPFADEPVTPSQSTMDELLEIVQKMSETAKALGVDDASKVPLCTTESVTPGPPHPLTSRSFTPPQHLEIPPSFSATSTVISPSLVSSYSILPPSSPITPVSRSAGAPAISPSVSTVDTDVHFKQSWQVVTDEADPALQYTPASLSCASGFFSSVTNQLRPDISPDHCGQRPFIQADDHQVPCQFFDAAQPNLATHPPLDLLDALIKPKSRRVIRKPKTYSQRVSSRFCHICSRMPRKGQRSAVCCNMQKGLCRKIVCERCITEQNWVFPSAKDANTWMCPHCAGACPARSQCIIYSRINARRKKIGETDEPILIGETGKSIQIGETDEPIQIDSLLASTSPVSGALVEGCESTGVSPQSAFDSASLLLAPYVFLLEPSQSSFGPSSS